MSKKEKGKGAENYFSGAQTADHKRRVKAGVDLVHNATTPGGHYFYRGWKGSNSTLAWVRTTFPEVVVTWKSPDHNGKPQHGCFSNLGELP